MLKLISMVNYELQITNYEGGKSKNNKSIKSKGENSRKSLKSIKSKGNMISGKCFVTRSAEETMKLGEEFGKVIKNSQVVVSLIGDLGGGKTTFTKGVARALGVKEEVRSPTFVMLKEYQTKYGKLVHVDAYRLGADFEDIGLADYFDQAKVFIEWAGNIAKILPKEFIEINFEHQQGDVRKICIRLGV